MTNTQTKKKFNFHFLLTLQMNAALMFLWNWPNFYKNGRTFLMYWLENNFVTWQQCTSFMVFGSRLFVCYTVDHNQTPTLVCISKVPTKSQLDARYFQNHNLSSYFDYYLTCPPPWWEVIT
jgi:hypothetical protein